MSASQVWKTRRRLRGFPAAFPLGVVCERMRPGVPGATSQEESTVGTATVVIFTITAFLWIPCVVFVVEKLGEPPGWLLAVLVLSGPGAVAAIGAFKLRRAHRKRPCDPRWLARMGVCPSCGVSLPHNVEPDGCIVCSCGAAWRATAVSSSRIRPRNSLGRIIDHRRVRHFTIDPREMLPAGEAALILKPTTADRINRGIVGALMIAFGSIFLVNTLNVSGGYGTVWSSATIALGSICAIAVACVGLVFLVGAVRGTMQPAARTIARRMLDRRICPACATPDIQPDATNATLLRCEACDALWHATKAVSSANED